MGTICGNGRKGNGMLFQILRICECHVCGRMSESSCTKNFRNHSFRHKASARQRSLSRKRVRKKTTRHAKADYGNSEEGSIRVRIKTRQARKVEIHEREEREKNCQFPRKAEKKYKNGNTTVESYLPLNRFHQPRGSLEQR